MDLIFALPGQTLSQWEDTLNEVMVLAPEHISTYNLVIEEGTKFHRWQRAGKLLPICEELDLKMYQMARELLSKEGYMHYEISSFAHGGRSCEHNLTYWRNKSYLGFGPGAHSYYNGERRGNTADISKYANELSKGLSPASFRETIGEEMEQVETMILGLRLSRGIAREEFRYRFGCDPIEVFGENISPLRAEGLLKVDEERLSLTEKGLIFANQVFMAFLPE
jgi:oxygen-independent coproporphyrinogen-3 oxidase